MGNPRNYQFSLPRKSRPARVLIDQERYPGIEKYVSTVSSTRRYHPVDGVRAIVVHATAGSSSSGAISVIQAGKASFHWLVPAENEPQHEHFVWSAIPEELAAWHVRNSASHPKVWGGRNLVNHYSIGIEVVNAQKPNDEFSEWQLRATAEVIRYCWSKYPNLRQVVSHARLDPDRRSDPGSHFPWDRLKKQVLDGREAPVPELVAAAFRTDLANAPTQGCCMG